MIEGRGVPPDWLMGQCLKGSQAPRVHLGSPAHGDLLVLLAPRVRRVMVRRDSQGHLAAQGTLETGVHGDLQASKAGRESVGHQASWERQARRETAVHLAPRVRRARQELQDGQGHRAEREYRDPPGHGARRVMWERPVNLASRLPVWPLSEERRVTEDFQDQRGLLAPRAM